MKIEELSFKAQFLTSTLSHSIIHEFERSLEKSFQDTYAFSKGVQKSILVDLLYGALKHLQWLSNKTFQEAFSTFISKEYNLGKDTSLKIICELTQKCLSLYDNQLEASGLDSGLDRDLERDLERGKEDFLEYLFINLICEEDEKLVAIKLGLGLWPSNLFQRASELNSFSKNPIYLKANEIIFKSAKSLKDKPWHYHSRKLYFDLRQVLRTKNFLLEKLGCDWILRSLFALGEGSKKNLVKELEKNFQKISKNINIENLPDFELLANTLCDLEVCQKTFKDKNKDGAFELGAYGFLLTASFVKPSDNLLDSPDNLRKLPPLWQKSIIEKISDLETFKLYELLKNHFPYHPQSFQALKKQLAKFYKPEQLEPLFGFYVEHGITSEIRSAACKVLAQIQSEPISQSKIAYAASHDSSPLVRATALELMIEKIVHEPVKGLNHESNLPQ